MVVYIEKEHKRKEEEKKGKKKEFSPVFSLLSLSLQPLFNARTYHCGGGGQRVVLRTDKGKKKREKERRRGGERSDTGRKHKMLFSPSLLKFSSFCYKAMLSVLLGNEKESWYESKGKKKERKKERNQVKAAACL
jgi:hypothetical protein